MEGNRQACARPQITTAEVRAFCKEHLCSVLVHDEHMPAYDVARLPLPLPVGEEHWEEFATRDFYWGVSS